MDSALLASLIDLVATVLLHSLWQGAVIGLLYALSMLYLRGSSPRLRYGFAVFWLGLLAVAPLITALVVWQGPTGALALPGSAALPLPAFAANEVAWISRLAPLWVALWLAGVSVLSLRLLRNWHQTEQLTQRGCHPLGGEWDQRLAMLARQLGVSRSVRLVESVVVSVPTVIGWLKPVILIPSSALLGLSQRQLELVVAHELAHIARLDYGVNYLLVIVETLWFHHPAVYLIGRGIREERELCCDDLVVSRCGSRFEYVTALTDLETLRSQHLLSEPLSNIAATGGNLLHRVQRIVKGHAPQPGGIYLVGAALVLTVLLGGVVLFAPSERTVSVASSFVGSAPFVAGPVGARPAMLTNIRPIETVVRGSPIGTADARLAESRALALIEAPLSIAQPDRDDGPVRRTDSAEWAPPEIARPILTLASLSKVAVIPDPPEPERAGPTRAIMNELDLASPMIESLADLRRDASRALAAASAAPFGVADQAIEAPGELMLTDVTSAALREQGGALIKRIEPRYPSRARLRGYTDTVQIEFLVTDTGEVSDIEVVSAQSKPAFERAVVRAVREWRYEPLLRDGVPVERRMVETFAFRLVRGSGENVGGAGCRRDKNNRFTCNTPGLSRVL